MTLLKTRRYMMVPISLGCLFARLAFGQPPSVTRHATTDLSKLIFVGDSLTAGYQNFSLLGSQQVHGYAAVIAQQAGALSVPLMAAPGVPNVLQLVSFGPPP